VNIQTFPEISSPTTPLVEAVPITGRELVAVISAMSTGGAS
jgi:hypothetical protein